MTADRAPGQAQHPRVRKGRAAALGLAVLTTAVAFLGGVGVLPSSATGRGGHAAIVEAADHSPGVPQRDRESLGVPTHARPLIAPTSPSVTPPGATTSTGAPGASASTALPGASGNGRRVVFSQSGQRVWIVDASDDHVARSYPVSGSRTDNLDPGTYTVYSRSMHAIGIDDSGTMTHFVGFTQGPSGAMIGFHDIPRLHGNRIQTVAQLGTRLSHGCIRQAEGDAVALWRFAQLGTKVVVVA